MQRSIAKEKGTTLDLDSRSTSVEASLDPLFHDLKIDTEAQTETETCIETKAKSAMEHPQTLQGQGCKLESLPSEIRRHILSVSDLTQLKSLVQASPSYYQQYIFDKRYLLETSLKQTLGDCYFDACVVYLCMTQERDIPKLFQLYSEHTTSGSSGQFNTISREQASHMASFYWNIVRPLVDYCAHWALDNLAREARKDPHYHTTAVTRTEKRRITRAAYRFYVVCNILDCSYHSEPSWEPDLDLASYCHTFIEPWEVEEVYSFFQFAADQLREKALGAKSYLVQAYSRFKPRREPPSPLGWFEDGDGKFSHL